VFDDSFVLGVYSIVGLECEEVFEFYSSHKRFPIASGRLSLNHERRHD
jgi:hypothetical protein